MTAENPRSFLNQQISLNAYVAFAHPHRRAILKDLYYEGKCSAKRFKTVLKIRAGTLYHHLKNLTSYGLITQDENRKYLLTKQGFFAVKLIMGTNLNAEMSLAEIQYMMEQNGKQLPDSNSQKTVKQSTNSVVQRQKSDLIEKLTLFLVELAFERPLGLFIFSVVSIFVLVVCLDQLKLGLIGCYFYKTNEILQSSLTIILSLTLIIVAVQYLPLLFSKKEPFTLEILALVLSLYVPFTVATLMLTIIKATEFIETLGSWPLVLVELFGQLLWMIWLYLVFQRINSLDSKTALLCSLSTNYALSLIAFTLL